MKLGVATTLETMMAVVSESKIEALSSALDTANRLMLASLVVAAIAAAVVAVSTFLVIRWQGKLDELKNAAFVSYKLESAKTVAEAGAVAAEANKKAAEANERTAQATLAFEQLKKAVGPRNIDFEQFVSVLNRGPKAERVTILHVRDDGEAYWLAMQIFMVLTQAGWPASHPEAIRELHFSPDFNKLSDRAMLSSSMLVSAQPTGVSVVAHRIEGSSNRRFASQQYATPYEALSAAILATLGRVGGGSDEGLPMGELRVVVSSRP